MYRWACLTPAPPTHTHLLAPSAPDTPSGPSQARLQWQQLRNRSAALHKLAPPDYLRLNKAHSFGLAGNTAG